MKNKFLLILIFCLITACNREVPKDIPEHQVRRSPQPVKAEPAQKSIEIPATVESETLVNNSTPIPQGYSVDTTYLKKPMLIDFNGDGKLDAFRVLKNPNKKGMQYLFEFRIRDSKKVYFYEDAYGNDLDAFGVFEIASKDEIYVDDEHRFESYTGNIRSDEEVDPKYYLEFKADGVSVNVLEDTCAVSVFFLVNEKIKRIHLC